MRLLISIFLSALFSTSIYVGSASANKTWVSTWTNSDGSESKTKAVFYSEFKRNGQLGHYGWSNGRFMGITLTEARVSKVNGFKIKAGKSASIP